MDPTRLGQFDLFECKVVRRDSRVIVIASRNGKKFRAHLRNTGRLKALIYPGATIACEEKTGGKTDARVIGARKNRAQVLLDTYVQENMFEKILESGVLEWLPSSLEITSQISYEGKRFDFGVRVGDEIGYLELKSAVTCEHGWASYPDAPSKRGLEHIKLLTEVSSEGFGAYVVFIVTHPNCNKFRPNRETQPEIVEELKAAEKAGVGVYSLKMVLTNKGEVLLTNPDIPVNLEI